MGGAKRIEQNNARFYEEMEEYNKLTPAQQYAHTIKWLEKKYGIKIRTSIHVKE